MASLLTPSTINPKAGSRTLSTAALELEGIAIIQLHDAPRLLVEWSPRWENFVSSIRPALARSGPRLAGEAATGIFPYRGVSAAFLLEALFLFALMVLPREIDRLRPYAAPSLRPDEVIYYSADELPRVQDLGGAQSGASGRAGGQQAHHRTQTIRVARGGSLAAQVVDAPHLKLPSSSAAVANLLAFKSNPAASNPGRPNPGPPPSEGLHSSLVAPSLPPNVIAPAQVNVARDRSRGGLSVGSVVPPAPSVQSEHRLVAPSLSTSVIAPAPNVSRERSLSAPAFNAEIIGPASTQVSRDRARSTPALNSHVIPPASASVTREVSPSRAQMAADTVVPPPVSAPERESARTAKLALPGPSVVAPPPSADSSHDLRRLESGSNISSPAVVPPPPSQTGGASMVSSLIGKLFGTQSVVPPPPTVSSQTRGPSGATVSANVVPPPPQASGTNGGGSSGTGRQASLAAQVVPPPPSVGGSGSGGSATNRTANGFGNGVASNVIPPPPSAGSGTGASGSGRKGPGLGTTGDSGSVLAPPRGAGENHENAGVVVSAQPGSNIGLPGNGAKASLALSPSGGDKAGLGGSGGGSSIGYGNGPGSGLKGEASGAGKVGTGHGSDDPTARGGISPTPGPGGAGSAATGSPPAPGVDVSGGSTIVTLPSFGSAAGSNDPNLPGRSSVQAQRGPSITIVATSRSGGAFDFYGKLPGDNYTVYVDTAIGTVVMQFAEANPAARAGALTGPQGLRTNLPAGLSPARIVIKCKLDTSGNLKSLQVLEPGPAAMTARIMEALPGWKFRPAMRGAQPIEVNAILGFNIDTNDRY